jgi:PhnB protein
MQLEPYLFFEGRCEEAIEFYRGALDAKVEAMIRYKDAPDPPPPGMLPPGSENRIMHSLIRIHGNAIMASDGNCSGKPAFGGFALTLAMPDTATADRLYAALSQGGQVVMPLGKTFWSPRFGMVTDRFGVRWMINVVE